MGHCDGVARNCWLLQLCEIRTQEIGVMHDLLQAAGLRAQREGVDFGAVRGRALRASPCELAHP